jgi:hypothetical protein
VPNGRLFWLLEVLFVVLEGLFGFLGRLFAKMIGSFELRRWLFGFLRRVFRVLRPLFPRLGARFTPRRWSFPAVRRRFDELRSMLTVRRVTTMRGGLLLRWLCALSLDAEHAVRRRAFRASRLAIAGCVMTGGKGDWRRESRIPSRRFYPDCLRIVTPFFAILRQFAELEAEKCRSLNRAPSFQVIPSRDE